MLKLSLVMEISPRVQRKANIHQQNQRQQQLKQGTVTGLPCDGDSGSHVVSQVAGQVVGQIAAASQGEGGEEGEEEGAMDCSTGRSDVGSDAGGGEQAGGLASQRDKKRKMADGGMKPGEAKQSTEAHSGSDSGAVLTAAAAAVTATAGATVAVASTDAASLAADSAN